MGADTYVISTWIFFRLLGLIYLIAFVSLGLQIRGLAGSRGILPAANLFRSARWRTVLLRPSLCWFSASDRFLSSLCWTGAGSALLLVAGVAPIPLLLLLWLIYLSLVNACGVFLAFQWDALLLEMGFLAVLLAPPALFPTFPPAAAPPALAHTLMLWLLFRVVFSSGMAKLRSGDPTWRKLTALQFHYETQPLPNRVSWYAHQLPAGFHKLSAALMFAIELAVPLLIFAPRPACFVAALLITLLMLLIMLTGNYGFFNLQVIALTVLLVDDALALRLLPWAETARPPQPPPLWWQAVVWPAGIVLLALSLDPWLRLLGRSSLWPKPVQAFLAWLLPLRIVHGYGLFSVMTTSRPEIIVEGSVDGGRTWRPYAFKWKPCDPHRPPRAVAPHQPRLDWQMWFAALRPVPEDEPWLKNFLVRLLEGSPDVLRLLHQPPWPDGPPPTVRVVVYDYRFTSWEERRRSGAWWRRQLVVKSYASLFNIVRQTTP